MGTLPIEVDMNWMPNLDLKKEEPHARLLARIANLYSDASSSTLDPGLKA